MLVSNRGRSQTQLFKNSVTKPSHRVPNTDIQPLPQAADRQWSLQYIPDTVDIKNKIIHTVSCVGNAFSQTLSQVHHFKLKLCVQKKKERKHSQMRFVKATEEEFGKDGPSF